MPPPTAENDSASVAESNFTSINQPMAVAQNVCTANPKDEVTPQVPTEPARVLKRVEDIRPGRYVKLDPNYMKHHTWTNDPNDLDLYGAFGTDEPNLASDFRIEELQPIITEKKGDEWILRDTKRNYYVWDLWDGYLLRVPQEYIDEADEDDGKWNEGLGLTEKIVRNILRNLSWIKEEADEMYR